MITFSAAYGPEHAGLFETSADDSPTSGFDNTGTNKEPLATELWIAHAYGITSQRFCLASSLALAWVVLRDLRLTSAPVGAPPGFFSSFTHLRAQLGAGQQSGDFLR
jgi:hypothetical protein